MRSQSLMCLALVAGACGSSSTSSPPQNSPEAGPPAFAGLPSGPIGTVGAARLLAQGTFGATLDGIKAASSQTYAQWFSGQVSATPSLVLPQVPQTSSDRFTPWWTNAVNGPDQLRQRVAFALSEILVVSQVDAHQDAQSVSGFGDLLVQNCLGNFRDLLDKVTRSPAMGEYLTYLRNDKPNPAKGSHADENYAREIMQLFTVGLVMLNQDGTVKTDQNGAPVPTYGLPEITNLARVFTGWGSNPIPPHTAGDESAWVNDTDLLHPMTPYPQHHDTDAKTIIGGVNIPAGGTCESDLKIALDTLFHHPNVGPFIGKQLIQRLVTSNPSPAYVSRVAAAFADDGHGDRGNLLAVVEAILTDPEARTAGMASKLREPILRMTELYRAFAATDIANDGKIPEYQVTSTQGYLNFGEAPYLSPTVFNFFRPNYARPGPLVSGGLVAPEFQITNEYSVVVASNTIEGSVYQFIDSSGQQHASPNDYMMTTSPTSVMLHTAQWEPFASDPGMLADNLSLVLMAGQMPAAMKTTIVDYVNQVPASQAGQRVDEATFLVAISPQYAIQR